MNEQARKIPDPSKPSPFLRLFQVRLGKRVYSEDGAKVYFQAKPQAKQVRDALIRVTGEPWVVSPGPDHRRAKPEGAKQ